MSRAPIALAAILAAGGVIAAAAAAGPSTTTAPAPGADPVAKAQALTTAPQAGPGAYAPGQAREAAGARGADVPLPAGGAFSGIRWELNGGDIAARTMDGVLQYNAACQWLRAWRDRREAEQATAVLERVPSWPAFRGTESAALLTRVAADVRGGGGEDASSMLVDCDAGHARELEYAQRLGLPASS